MTVPLTLSIIVPAYNEGKTIAKTIQGLTQQTYAHIELIIIDNNSKDDTFSVAKKLTTKVFQETKQGYIHAVRKGAEVATSDLITFCDADSFYPITWAADIVNAFTHDSTIVAAYGTADTHDASPIQNWINYMGYTAFLYISRWLGLDNTSGFNFVMRRSAYDQVGGYNPAYQKMSPDIELGKRLKNIGKIAFCPKIKVSSSFRRFNDKGQVKTTLMFAKAWWSMLRNKVPTVNYKEYNS